MPKIFITRKIPDVGIEMLKSKGYEVDIYPKDKMPSQREILGYLKRKEYDAVLSLLTDKIDAKFMDTVPTVKIYSNFASGFDNIDVAEANKRGVAVANSPATSTSEAVADHAISMALALYFKLGEADRYVRKGKYKGWNPNIFIGSNIPGKTFGLIGSGRIGAQVAKYAKALGMKVVYYDVIRNENLEKEHGAEFFSSVDDVLKQSDIVSLHVPLLDSTRHLINETNLKLMKQTAVLVNTSRGPVIDEKALAKALSDKVIAGAALDVFEFEPKITKGLLKLFNVILTPHIASASVEVRNEMATMAADNIIEFLEGRSPKNLVSGK